MQKISKFGTDLLNELSDVRSGFKEKKHDAEFARAFSTMANSTCRAMRETLNARKYETAVLNSVR
jgi:hypothetical protein